MKNLICLFLSLMMVFTTMPLNFSVVLANQSETNTISLDEIEVPDIHFSCSPITRVALEKDSMKAGTTIVKATPSGVPELSGDYVEQAYAGEVPVATQITFQSNDSNVVLKGISCNNASVI